MPASALLAVACLLIGAAALQPEQRPASLTAPTGAADTAEVGAECHWHDYATAANITSWEFQMRSDDASARSRRDWQHIVEHAFGPVERRFPEFRMHRHSRRSMILRETEQMVSTKDGQPLDPAARGTVAYPWKEVGVLRLRRCLGTEAHRTSEHPKHLLNKGEADLTLKLKAVDPPTFPRLQDGFPAEVGHAHLGVKMENDVHCDYQRTSYSAAFMRGQGLHHTMLTTLAGVKGYFPTLPSMLHLAEDFPLPLNFDHYMSKTYWDVEFGPVPGTVQLYLNYTSKATALDGQETVLWELSLRVTRRAAEAAGPLERALELLASIGDMLMRNGWHGIQRQQD